ncbi:MAG: hypothetical protein ABI806_25200 [Candidatus Solibacter sp.]
MKGLAAATLGGAISSAARAAASGTLAPANLKTAALALAAYLTKSPVGSR